MKELQSIVIILIINITAMSAETLYSLISSIRVSRIRLGKLSRVEENKKPWTTEQEKIFYNLIIEYGSDLTLIQNFFPERSRKQIKKKHRDICELRRKIMQREESRRIRESRKSYFDDEILEQRMMKWPSKPNKSGSSSQI